MAFFSTEFRRRIRHSAESFLLLGVIFLSAIGLTFVEDWLHDTHRPGWLISGVQVLEIALFIADGIGFLCLCIRIVLHSIRDLWRHK